MGFEEKGRGEEMHLFVAFALGGNAGVFVCVAPAFGQEVVVVAGVVAEDYTRGGEVEYADAGADG